MNIDYEITVDVSNADIETKKRVQDAFFKLGFAWWDGDKYSCLNRDYYTNTLRSGQVTQNLMWCFSTHKPTHTIDQLLELAGMKTETKLIPFDLEKALAGEPVVLRNGLKAYIRHRETELESAPFLGFFVQGDSLGVGAWKECGANYWSRRRIVESDYDIVGMWTEPLVFEHWDLLSEDIKYLAKDVYGGWYGYSKKPTRDGIEWFVRSYADYYPLKALHPKLFPECSWENSLIERPENV